MAAGVTGNISLESPESVLCVYLLTAILSTMPTSPHAIWGLGQTQQGQASGTQASYETARQQQCHH